MFIKEVYIKEEVVSFQGAHPLGAYFQEVLFQGAPCHCQEEVL
jgi:hypothetical protein